MNRLPRFIQLPRRSCRRTLNHHWLPKAYESRRARSFRCFFTDSLPLREKYRPPAISLCTRATRPPSHADGMLIIFVDAPCRNHSGSPTAAFRPMQKFFFLHSHRPSGTSSKSPAPATPSFSSPRQRASRGARRRATNADGVHQRRIAKRARKMSSRRVAFGQPPSSMPCDDMRYRAAPEFAIAARSGKRWISQKSASRHRADTAKCHRRRADGKMVAR